jgi:hypothetical protein
MSIEFTAGNFVALRAVTNFHLGQIERDVVKGEVVEYDGVTLKLGDVRHNIPTIRAAVKAGWLVPVSDTTTVYRPQSAQVAVHAATSSARDRGAKFDLQTVHDEDRDLGNLKKVRDRGDGTVRKMAVVAEEASSEGVAVGRINRPTHMKSKFTVENEMRLAQEVRRVDNVEGSPDKRVTPIRHASDADILGEVQIVGSSGARSGDAISELLGGDEGVVVAKLPPVSPTNPLGEGDSPHLTAEEKAAKLAATREAAEAARQARIAAANASAGKLGVGPDAAPPEEAPEVLPADLGQKVLLVRAVIPNFEWDMTRPWRTRVVDAVKRYGKNPLYLNGILSVETDAVKTHIAQNLSKA